MSAYGSTRCVPTGLGGLAAVGLAILPAACASSPTRFFTLDAVPPVEAASAPYQGPPIRVSAVRIPPVLDRNEVVEETAPEQVRVSDLDHWAAPLGLMARQALIQDLAARLPPGELQPPDTPPRDLGVDLGVDILSYSVVGRIAVMQVGWRLSGSGISKHSEAVVELQAVVSQGGSPESPKASPS